MYKRQLQIVAHDHALLAHELGGEPGHDGGNHEGYHDQADPVEGGGADGCLLYTSGVGVVDTDHGFRLHGPDDGLVDGEGATAEEILPQLPL